MFETFCLGVALTVGQGSPTMPIPPAPSRTPVMLPSTSPMTMPSRIPGVVTSMPGGEAPAAAPGAASAGAGCANCEEKKEEKEEEKGHFMKLVEGTCFGSILEEKGIKVDGWVASSYTGTIKSRNSSLPVTWNDRSNTFLLQQAWVNVEKATDHDSNSINYGWKVAFLAGSDYRFTLIRGFLNEQLKNTTRDPNEVGVAGNTFQQNLYGVDIPIFTASAWVPGLGGEGTEFTIGRMFCQFGYESVMATATPLLSRSYAFNWAPPFFHVGAMATTVIDKNLTVKNMIVNGNDVFFDGSQEWRYAGQLVWTSDDGDTSLALGTSIGRGKFNAGRPNGPAQGITTVGLAFEPAGRNNINVFDIVYTQKLSENLSYAAEVIYGYQQSVPAGATGNAGNFNGGTGTAHWGSLVNYLTYTISDELSTIARFEIFNDAQGQRTGFEGCYYSTTIGVQYKPCDSVLIRPEVRYDYNGYSRPFDQGLRHGLWSFGAEAIFKF